MNNQNLGYLLKALILSFLVTAILIVIFAFTMFKLNISEDVIGLGVAFIYIISCAIGGFYIGKSIKEKKFMWGFFVGLLYMLVLMLVSAIIGGGNNMLSENGFNMFLLCAGGGMLGGMFA